MKKLLLILSLSILFSHSAYAPVYFVGPEDIEKSQNSENKNKKKKTSFHPYNKKITKDGVKLEEFIVSKYTIGRDGTIITLNGDLRVGDNVVVIMKLKNTKKKTLYFEKYGIFVGCRWERKEGKEKYQFNKDFGHTGFVFIHPGKTMLIIAKTKVDKPGTWYFWPAYWLKDHFGPYMWGVKKFKVTP